MSLSAKAALLRAEAEGLTLHRSERSNTGYKNVAYNGNNNKKPYQAQVRRGGKLAFLGSFATAEEAALCYARTYTEAELRARAKRRRRRYEAKWLADVRQSIKVWDNHLRQGLPHAPRLPPRYSQQYSQTRVPRLGELVCEQVGWALSGQPPPLQQQAATDGEEALRQAEAEGLTLLKSEASSTGYKGVSFFSANSKLYMPSCKPYYAHVKRGRKQMHLGVFATAEEAALHVARDSVAQAVAPQPTATSSRKRKVKSEEQPPDMPAGARVKLEEQPPPMPNDAVVKLE